MDVPDRDPSAQALSRDAVIAAALDLAGVSGLEGLTMRSLGDRLGVKAASLYWHFRDKEQLLDALVVDVLDRVPVATAGRWRARVAGACAGLDEELARHPAAAPLLLGRVSAVRGSRLAADIAGVLASAGLPGADAAAVSLVMQTAATPLLAAVAPPLPPATQVMRVEVEAGSWRVALRAGTAGSIDVATAVGSGRAGPFVEARGDDTVVVRNWRGGNRGAVELNPAYTWLVKVHSGAWNVALDLSGLRVGGIDFDSGTGNITCTLPPPVGAVPVRINSGIVGVTVHRPRNAAARALVHGGCFRVRFDDRAIRATASDVHVQSSGADSAPDCYDITVHGGCVKVVLDAAAPAAAPAPPPPDSTPRATTSISAVDLLLDGIEARLSA